MEKALRRIEQAKQERALELDLRDCGLKELPDELFELTWLEELILGYFLGSSVSDISGLKHLTNLQTLNLMFTQVSDIAELKHLTNLRMLNLMFTQVSDIAELKHLTNLETLDLAGTQVSDIAELKHLTNLRMLNLMGTQVSDITPLLRLLKKPLHAVSREYFFSIDPCINLYSTPLPNIIYDLLDDDNKKLINYLEQIAQAENPPQQLYEAKLMVVGEPGAGKTSLMKKLLDPTYVLPRL